MTTNLINLVRQWIPDEAIGKIGGLLGESGASTQKAVEAGIPTLLAGLLHTASTPSGAGRLANMVGGEEGAKAGDILSNIGGILGGQTDELLKFGQKIVSNLFGSNLSSVLDVLSKYSGMKLSSISSLMGMLAPLVLGVLRQQTASQGFSPSSLINLLTSQKDAIARQAPAGLAGALGLNSLTNLGVESEAIRHPAVRAAEYGSDAVRRTAEAAEQRTSWLKWALPLGLLVLLGCALAYFLSGKREPAVQTAKDVPPAPARKGEVREAARPAYDTGDAGRKLTRVSLPGGASLDVQEGSALDGIVKYVEDPSGSRPNVFVFEGLGFNANNAVSFSPEASARIGNLAAILRAFPTARLKIEGHTDDVGDPATNRRLSLDRADAIKRLLIRAGVPAERITTEGVGPDRPIATNATEDGRAKNRRIELAVATEMTRISLPGGASLDVQEGSALDGIVKYVEDPSGSRPNVFVFEGLGFNANNAVSFSPEASARIGNLAAILRAFPTARLKIEGHTDDVGDPATNRRLSLDRADAIKRLLIRAGVPAERITTEGVGPDRPIATNATEDGRAKNRRIELAITVK